MKMYIIVRDDVPDRLVPVITAHASLACYRQYQYNADMEKWINGIFRKVVCCVNPKEFEDLKNESDYTLLTESTLDGREVCLSFCPREEYPARFKYFKLWEPVLM